MKEYKTVSSPCENVMVIRKSRFICSVAMADGEEVAKQFIESVRKKYSLANHHCYAYIADEGRRTVKFSDDGEPQGTAGAVMLEALKNNGYAKTVVIVSRFFGGILLGTGGLSRAYGGSVTECLKVCPTAIMRESVVAEIKTDYNTYSRISSALNTEFVKVLSTDFSDGVKITFGAITENFDAIKTKIINLSSGSAIINKIESKYIAF